MKCFFSLFVLQHGSPRLCALGEPHAAVARLGVVGIDFGGTARMLSDVCETQNILKHNGGETAATALCPTERALNASL